MGEQGTAGEVELAPGGQDVNHRPGHQQRSRALGREGVGDEVLPVDHCDSTSAEDCEPASIVNDGGRVLIHSHAEQRGRLSHQRQQPSVAIALFEVLVDHDAAEQAEPGGQLAHSLLGCGAARAERDHVLSQDAGPADVPPTTVPR